MRVRRALQSADDSVFDVRRFADVDQASRNRVLDAVARLQNRATAAEVAAESGLPLKVADRAMQSLVQDVKGSLQVSSAGDIVYEVPGDCRAQLLRNSLKLRLEPAVNACADVLAYVARVSFGAALFVSVLTTYIAIFAVLQSQSSDRDRNRGGDSGWGGSRGGMGMNFNIITWDPYAVWFWDPYYQSKSRARAPGEMSFLEAVFSVVFGDGDPNATFEEERWARVGRYIQARGGVVTALELAPLLDPPSRAALEDEAFMVPALLKFDGDIKVTEHGDMLYVFPQFQRVSGPAKASRGTRGLQDLFGQRSSVPVQGPDSPGLPSPMLEREWRLSKAPAGSQFGAFLLGAVNVGGVAFLTNLVAGVPARALAMQNLGWIPAVLPALQAYAALFVAMPLIRMVWNSVRNAKVSERNSARQAAAQVLVSGSPVVKTKLAAARRLASTTSIADSEVVYDSQLGTGTAAEDDVAAFDRRLAERQGEHQRSGW